MFAASVAKKSSCAVHIVCFSVAVQRVLIYFTVRDSHNVPWRLVLVEVEPASRKSSRVHLDLETNLISEIEIKSLASGPRFCFSSVNSPEPSTTRRELHTSALQNQLPIDYMNRDSISTIMRYNQSLRDSFAARNASLSNLRLALSSRPGKELVKMP